MRLEGCNTMFQSVQKSFGFLTIQLLISDDFITLTADIIQTLHKSPDHFLRVFQRATQKITTPKLQYTKMFISLVLLEQILYP